MLTKQFMLFRFTHLDEDLEREHECADGGEEAEPEGGAGRHAALVHAGEDSGGNRERRFDSNVLGWSSYFRSQLRSHD